MTIDKREFKYILYASGFAILLFMVILPWAVKTFNGDDIVFQFLFFSLGLYAFFSILLKAIVMNTSISLKASVGFLALFLGLDNIAPEYHITTGGELIKGAALGVSTPDYFFGYLVQSLGFSGFPVYFIVYIIITILLLFISAISIKNFVRHV